MNLLLNTLNNLIPLLGVIFLFTGINAQRINFIIAAFWLSLIGLILHYQTAGGELLGSYFGYQNATLYSINLLVLVASILYLLFRLPLFKKRSYRYLLGLIAACLIIGVAILLTNLWVNAHFIEHKKPGTPVLQVATASPIVYCNYRYVFYRIDNDGKVSYMCPNYYGILPSVGHLDVTPEFVLHHLAQTMETANFRGSKPK
jgi:multisubunit Na+/H+ antiporter MnhE subunit